MSVFFLDVSFETPILIYIVFNYICQGKFAFLCGFSAVLQIFLINIFFYSKSI